MKNQTKGLWYFAHPYTCRDKEGRFLFEGEDANFRICNYRASRLLLLGFNIYSPISHTHPIHSSCPEFLSNQEHELWYELDNEFIDKTDWSGIILAPGWENSSGCVAEKERFEKRELPVLYYEEIIQGNTYV